MAHALENTSEQASSPSNGGGLILFGRFMLPDMTEHPCQVAKLSLSKAVLLSDLDVPAGVQVVAYIEDVGRIEGKITAHIPGGFEIGFELNDARRERFKQRLVALRDMSSGSSVNNRRHPRFEPADTKSQLALPDGRVYACEVQDISLSGAAITTDILPSLGTTVMLGKMSGRVVRYLPNGLAIEFTKQLDQQTLHAQIR